MILENIEIFTRRGLVERSGQRMNLIFEESIHQSKPVPDFARTDQYQVGLTLFGTVQNPAFIRIGVHRPLTAQDSESEGSGARGRLGERISLVPRPGTLSCCSTAGKPAGSRGTTTSIETSPPL